MRSDWRVMPFSEAVVVNPRMRPVRGKAYPFISMAAVNPNSQWVEADQQREYGGGGSRFQHGDTLMARITPCLENGKIARYCSTDRSNVAFGSTEFIVFRGRPEITDNRFVYYLTQSAPVRDYAISQMTGTSGRQRVPTSALNHIDVALPPLAEQRRIAHILGTLDDKIELNRRMNATLEGMARALFKSWFVDFDPVRAKIEGHWRRGEALPGMPAELYDLFPDRLVPSEVGEAPEGWEVKNIGAIATIVGGTTPSTRKPEYWDGGIHHWVTPKDLSSLDSPVLSETARKITDAGLDRITSGILPIGSVLLSSRAPIGYLAISEVPVAINQGFIGILPNEGISNLFMLYWCKFSHTDIINHANGSTFLEINKRNFRQLQAIVPDAKILSEFDRLAQRYYRSIVLNEQQSRTLAALRAALLPGLVAGRAELQSD